MEPLRQGDDEDADDRHADDEPPAGLHRVAAAPHHAALDRPHQRIGDLAQGPPGRSKRGDPAGAHQPASQRAQHGQEERRQHGVADQDEEVVRHRRGVIDSSGRVACQRRSTHISGFVSSKGRSVGRSPGPRPSWPALSPSPVPRAASRFTSVQPGPSAKRAAPRCGSRRGSRRDSSTTAGGSPGARCDSCSPTTTAKRTSPSARPKAFVDSDRVVAVVGHLSSGPTRAALGVYTGGGDPIPLITPSASSPDLSGLSPWLFRICPSDLAHGTQLARYARQRLRAARAAVIYTDDDYGRGVRRTFVNEFTNWAERSSKRIPIWSRTAPRSRFSRGCVARGGAGRARARGPAGGGRGGAAGAARRRPRWPVIGGDALVGIESRWSPRRGRPGVRDVPVRPGRRSATTRS